MIKEQIAIWKGLSPAELIMSILAVIMAGIKTLIVLLGD